MIVTDIAWINKSGEKKIGFYMDGYEAENISGIPKHQSRDWDVIGIISGSGKVRLGKSCKGIQQATYVAWLKAGGKMDLDRDSPTYGKVLASPIKEIAFGLDNVVFSIEDLMKKAHKYPRESIFVLDECEGLDAKSTMMSLNKNMERFLQQCGVYNHYVIVVLPDYFSLNKSFATGRSNYLTNVYIGQGFKRGFFSFYSEVKKEKLYVFGRKLLGNFARYAATNPDFRGRFTSWLPFQKEEYEKKKRDALNKQRIGKRDAKLLVQRDFLLFLMKKHTDLTHKDICEELGGLLRRKMSIRTMEDALVRAQKQMTINDMLDEEGRDTHEENLEEIEGI